LPRLKGPEVLIEAVRDGIALPSWERDSFAYADSFDEVARRYRGLRGGQQVQLSAEAPHGLLVKPEVAKIQLSMEIEEPP
ncbi:hypothetical protein, partial [Klebsiella pneumoniae]|uniref:hypothetical protein n=1 Tax=Klebsiella pneumoniae TaxID=573 RepID=UPI003B591F54